MTHFALDPEATEADWEAARRMAQGAWRCHGCKRTFKGGGVHRTAATETDPVYRYCDNCWAKRPA